MSYSPLNSPQEGAESILDYAAQPKKSWFTELWMRYPRASALGLYVAVCLVVAMLWALWPSATPVTDKVEWVRRVPAHSAVTP